MNATEITWADLYDQAVESFGGTTPGATLEQQLLDHFRRHPAAVQAAIQKLADRYAQGKIHSPWPIVLTELQREDQRTTITASIDRERDQAIRLAELYITNAGLYIPTEQDLLDDTFGPHGRLRQWADDQPLRERILDHWRQQADRAERAEAASRAHTDAINTSRPATTDQPDPLADQLAWLDAGGWMDDPLDQSLLEHFPMTSLGDLPSLLEHAEHLAQIEFGGDAT